VLELLAFVLLAVAVIVVLQLVARGWHGWRARWRTRPTSGHDWPGNSPADG
jgi:hypothetical protein